MAMCCKVSQGSAFWLVVVGVFLSFACQDLVHAGPVPGHNAGKDDRRPFPDGHEIRVVEKRAVSMAPQEMEPNSGSRDVSNSASSSSDETDFDIRDKKNFGMGASGFHGDTFSNGFGSFSTMKRGPFGGGARGFHGDAFSSGFGEFSTMRKKKFGGQMDNAFHGRSAFSGGFGDFSTMKKRFMGPSGFHGDTFSEGFGGFSTMKRAGENARAHQRILDRQAYSELAALLERLQRMNMRGPAPAEEEY